ncbi:unnamed protein product [Acanthosepion pharaonis]|uniref:Uncharacterized protein n=1 Tax=Acanthosepion pharaonis TaxID=158019 RepID=A0A812DI10_ACAPH|nr:unnamed protein product [Sepia pharaonis]
MSADGLVASKAISMACYWGRQTGSERAWLADRCVAKGPDHHVDVDAALDAIAAVLEAHVGATRCCKSLRREIEEGGDEQPGFSQLDSRAMHVARHTAQLAAEPQKQADDQQQGDGRSGKQKAGPARARVMIQPIRRTAAPRATPSRPARRAAAAAGLEPRPVVDPRRRRDQTTIGRPRRQADGAPPGWREAASPTPRRRNC